MTPPPPEMAPDTLRDAIRRHGVAADYLRWLRRRKADPAEILDVYDREQAAARRVNELTGMAVRFVDGLNRDPPKWIVKLRNSKP